MLKLYESTPGTNVLSLRTGGPVATIHAAIINPRNLYIEGWRVEDNRTRQQLILLSNEIRDVLPQGIVINDYDVLSEAKDLIRLEELFKQNFNLLNLKVVSESGKSYGKLGDFAYETQNFFVQKLYVNQSLVKNFGNSMLSIDRSQIIEVTNRRVVIEDPVERQTSRAISPSTVS